MPRVFLLDKQSTSLGVAVNDHLNTYFNSKPMNTQQLLFAAGITSMLLACKTNKNKTTATTNSSPKPLVTGLSKGIYAPGKNELAAIQQQYQETTQEQLDHGYFLYTEGSCIKCHEAQSIYKYDTLKWSVIINRMAPMARLSSAEKKSVLLYVMAIKAAQPPVEQLDNTK